MTPSSSFDVFTLLAESVTNTLASKEELAAGVIIAHTGLGMPPRPPPVVPPAQLVAPSLEAGPCEPTFLGSNRCYVYVYPRFLLTWSPCSFCFALLAAITADALAGWTASLHNVYTIVRGYFVSISMFACMIAHVSCICVLFRSFSRESEEH